MAAVAASTAGNVSVLLNAHNEILHKIFLYHSNNNLFQIADSLHEQETTLTIALRVQPGGSLPCHPPYRWA